MVRMAYRHEIRTVLGSYSNTERCECKKGGRCTRTKACTQVGSHHICPIFGRFVKQLLSNVRVWPALAATTCQPLAIALGCSFACIGRSAAAPPACCRTLWRGSRENAQLLLIFGFALVLACLDRPWLIGTKYALYLGATAIPNGANVRKEGGARGQRSAFRLGAIICAGVAWTLGSGCLKERSACRRNLGLRMF